MSERQRVGDLLLGQHPALFVLCMVAIIGGAVMMLVPAIVQMIATPPPVMWRVFWAGGVIGLAGVLVFIVWATAVVAPWAGLGMLAVIAIGVGTGLTLRHRQRHP